MYIKNGCFRKYKYIISYVQPKIYEQPTDGYVQAGDNFKFSLKVRGSPPLTYQWYKNDFPLFGETTNELLLTDIQEINNGKYYCEVKNNKNTIESRNALLSVIKTPYVITDPIPVITLLGSNISFRASAIGTQPLAYQWYKNNTPYAGGTSTELYINSIKFSDAGAYWAVITNGFGSVVTLTANLIILD